MILEDNHLTKCHALHDIVHGRDWGPGLYDKDRNPGGCRRPWCLRIVPELTTVVDRRIREHERSRIASGAVRCPCGPCNVITIKVGGKA